MAHVPREALETPSLEILRSNLDMVQGNLVLVALLGDWIRGPSEFLTNLSHSVEPVSVLWSNSCAPHPSLTPAKLILVNFGTKLLRTAPLKGQGLRQTK